MSVPVSFNFPIFPGNAQLAERLRNPLGCVFSPLAPTSAPAFAYKPLMCAGCGATAQAFQHTCVDSQTWTCSFCGRGNAIPRHYLEHMRQGAVPPELVRENLFAEYLVGKANPETDTRPCFVFVLDQCVNAAELEAQKSQAEKIFMRLPSNASVALVTVSSYVTVYSFDNPQATPRLATFNAEHSEDLQTRLTREGRAMNFLVPLEEFEYAVLTQLQALTAVAQPPRGVRFERCTGTALALVQDLLELRYRGFACQVLTFLGGPVTTGHGRVAELSKATTLRSFFDLQKRGEATKLCARAKLFYGALARRAVKSGTSFDLFGCSQDQCGLFELGDLAQLTGGLLLLADSFSAPSLTNTLDRHYQASVTEGVMPSVTKVTVEVRTSANLGITGLLGPVVSKGLLSENVLKEKWLGCTGSSGDQAPTFAWETSRLDPDTQLALYLRPTGTQKPKAAGEEQEWGLVQISVAFTSRRGDLVQRVSTVAVPLSSDLQRISEAVDLQTHCFLTARVAGWLEAKHGVEAAQRTVDLATVRAFSLFQTTRTGSGSGSGSGFAIDPRWWDFANFVYHLKRSPLLNRFGSSPDEFGFRNSWLLRAGTADVIRMARPELWRFELGASEAAGQQVALESASLAGDACFVMHGFFVTAIFRTSNVHNWIQAGFHTLPEYQYIATTKSLAETKVAQCYAAGPLAGLFIDTHQGGSQYRFITSAVDPSFDHRSGRDSHSKADPNAYLTDATVVLSEERKFAEFASKLQTYASANRQSP